MEIEREGVLGDVLPEDYLEISGFDPIRNLRELVGVLERMSKEDFSLHVYGDQNDFAEWIMEAYWDEELTGKVLGIREKGKLIGVLGKVLRRAEKGRRIGKVGGKKKVLKEIGKSRI